MTPKVKDKHMKLHLLLILSIIINWGISMADFPSEPGDHLIHFQSSADGTEQPYRFYAPKQSESNEALPLIIVLHGKGVDHNAWFDFLPVEESAEEYGTYLAAPLGRGNWWYRGLAEQDVLDVVNDVKKHRKIDENRIYLMGHSMGGFGAMRIGLRNKGIFAAIAPLSGFREMDMLYGGKNLNSFWIHCNTDDVVPVKYSRSAAAYFAEHGFNSRYREENTYAHASSLITDNFPRTFPWFLEHTLNPSPTHITHAVRTPRKGKAFWLEVLETEQWPATATIEAISHPDGVLEINQSQVVRVLFETARLPHQPTSLLINGKEMPLLKEALEVPYLVVNFGEQVFITASSERELPTLHLEEFQSLSQQLQDKDQFEVTSILAAKMRDHVNADVAFFHRDDFSPQAFPITGEDLIDLYCYPIEDIAVFTATKTDIEDWIEKNPTRFYIAEFSSDAESKEQLQVIAPEDVAKKIGTTYKVLQKRPDQLLAEMMQQ